MSLREKLNKNGKLATVGAAVIIGIALVVVIWQALPSQLGRPKGLYFSMDDGKGYYTEDINAVPPITKDGKEAVQAMVFKCGWGKPFVGYLQKYTPEMKKRYEESIAAKTDLHPSVLVTGRLVKKPGDKDWTASDNPNYHEIADVRCPSGKLDDLKGVFP